MTLRTVNVTRYIAPLREGGSLRAQWTVNEAKLALCAPEFDLDRLFRELVL